MRSGWQSGVALRPALRPLERRAPTALRPKIVKMFPVAIWLKMAQKTKVKVGSTRTAASRHFFSNKLVRCYLSFVAENAARCVFLYIMPFLASMYHNTLRWVLGQKLGLKWSILKFLKRKGSCALAREIFFLDTSHFLILFCIIVGARAPASAPAFFGVALRLALRGNFRSCAPTALRLLGTALRSGAPRSAAFQYSDFLRLGVF